MEKHNLKEVNTENTVQSSKPQNVKLNIESPADRSAYMEAGTVSSWDHNSAFNSETVPKEDAIELKINRKPDEKNLNQRCRLFVGNLPTDITEEDFKKLFLKYSEANEVFINRDRGFGFIRLETRTLAEIAKAELDGKVIRNRSIYIRFATNEAALTVRNLSPVVSNELLEQAFSQFGPVERTVVVVDDHGRPTGKGIVEFANKSDARKALDHCADGALLITASPCPVILEPKEQFEDEDGLPEKLLQKSAQYYKEREHPPHFAEPGTFEFEYSSRWKALDNIEKQQKEQVDRNILEAKEKLEAEMEAAKHEHQLMMMRQDLMRRQEELRCLEELRNQELQKRKQVDLRHEEDRRRREEEMIRNREEGDVRCPPDGFKPNFTDGGMQGKSFTFIQIFKYIVFDLLSTRHTSSHTSKGYLVLNIS